MEHCAYAAGMARSYAVAGSTRHPAASAPIGAEAAMRDADRTGSSAAPSGPTTGGAMPRAPDSGGVELHRIVIVGGGAGGLELATRLGRRLGKRKKAWITLLDRGRTHIWKPLLHEVASGTMDRNAEAVPYMAQARWHHFRYRIGAMD